MKNSPQVTKIIKIIAPAVEDMGYELVRVTMTGSGTSKPTLQIMAELPDGTMGVEDCSRLSQAVSTILDVEDTISEAYYLEVSSPGLDRPLTRAKDFDLYKDNEVRIEMDESISGQKKFKGMLTGIDGTHVLLETDTGPVRLHIDDIFKAKLTLTHALMEKAIKASQPEKENKYAPKKKADKAADKADGAKPKKPPVKKPTKKPAKKKS